MTDAPGTAYDPIAEEYAATFDAPSDHLDALRARLPPTALVLDVGCGPGVDVAALAAEGHRVVGLDPSAGMARAARERTDAPVCRGDARALPFAPGTFDGVVASFSLVHVPRADLPGALSEIATVLRPGGHLLLGMHAGESGERTVPRPVDPSVAVRCTVVSPADLRADLDTAGLTVVERFERDPEPDELDVRKQFVVARRD